MGIDLNANLFPQLRAHLGHKLSCVSYGDPDDPVNVAIECQSCGCVLLDASPEAFETQQRFCDQFGDRGPWNEHPDYTRQDWRAEVASDYTHLGYWEWVEHAIEACESDHD